MWLETNEPPDPVNLFTASPAKTKTRVMNQDETYSFAFFFGPGLPLGFRSPSAAAEVLLIPFPVFFTPSVGGSIAVKPSVPLAAGVLGFDSEAFSPGEEVAPRRVLDVVDDAVFDSTSSLMIATGANGSRLCGDSLSLMIRLLGAFFGLAVLPDNGDALIVGAIFDGCEIREWWKGRWLLGKMTESWSTLILPDGVGDRGQDRKRAGWWWYRDDVVMLVGCWVGCLLKEEEEIRDEYGVCVP
jgi:hypothetical protein